MVKEITLNQDKVTLLDEEDYDKIKHLTIYSHLEKGKWYVKYYIKHDKSGRLGRLLLNAKENEQVDHINGNGLDNRRCNLRIVNGSQNQWNRGKSYNKSSQFKGVTWHKKVGKWQTQISKNGHLCYLGLFKEEVNAAKAYDETAIKIFGEYAKLNFPKEDETI